MSEENKTDAKYVMVESASTEKGEEIDLFELMLIILRSWKLIAIITVLCTGVAVIVAVLTPDMYRAETLLTPVREENSGIPSSLSQFGGFASLAGISIPADSDIERVFATLESRQFLKKYISKKNLLPVLFYELWDEKQKAWHVSSEQSEPTVESGFSVLKGAINVDTNNKSGLIVLSVTWRKPEAAAELANNLVKELNEQMREQAIADSNRRVGYLEQELAKTTLQDMRSVLYNLLESEKQKAMLANVNEDFALEVIDPAVLPRSPFEPNRKKIVILGVFCGTFFGIVSVFLLKLINKLRLSSPQKLSSHD